MKIGGRVIVKSNTTIGENITTRFSGNTFGSRSPSSQKKNKQSKKGKSGIKTRERRLSGRKHSKNIAVVSEGGTKKEKRTRNQTGGA